MLTRLDEEKHILSFLEEPGFMIEKPFEEVTANERATAIRGIAGKLNGLKRLIDKLAVAPNDNQDYIQIL